MRKINFLLSAIILPLAFQACKPKTQPAQTVDKPAEITTADNSQTSIDWVGQYQGIIPCADCEGIEECVILNDDLTYKLTSKYVGKEDANESIEGTFEWDNAGGIITLSGIPEGTRPNKYKVGEEALFRLDIEGHTIEGELREKYILRKVDK